MARYRVRKGRDGLYSVHAEIRIGREVVHTAVATKVKREELVPISEKLAGELSVERIKRGMVGSGAPLAGEAD